MPMPDEDFDGPVRPWTPEPLFCNGTKVYTLDQGLKFFRITHGPDNGLTEREARHWAELFAQASTMYAFLQDCAAADDNGPTMDAIRRAALRIMQACIPKPKGRPFKRHFNTDQPQIQEPAP